MQCKMRHGRSGRSDLVSLMILHLHLNSPKLWELLEHRSQVTGQYDEELEV